MSVDTCFACHNVVCIIFDDNCKYSRIKECEYYYSKKRGFPDGFRFYMEIVNMLAQARADRSQQRFNRYILILTTVAIVIAVLSFIVSLFN